MALSWRDFGYGISAYLTDGVGHGVTTALQATRTASFGISTFVMADQVARRRLTGSVQAGDRFPNAFYGIQQVNEASIELDNKDRRLNFLLSEEARKRPYRVRHIVRDADTDEVLDDYSLFSGVINEVAVGRAVHLGATSFDPTLLTKPLPIHRVYHTGQVPPTGATTLDLTVNFADATDTNVPVNILFGKAIVPCAYVGRDENASTYDYLVGEGADLEVLKVFKIRQGQWEESFNASGALKVGGHASVGLFEEEFHGQGDEIDGNAFYSTLYITITGGLGAGQTREILDVDIDNQTLFVHPWEIPPGPGSTYQLRTWKVLNGAPYYGRTAIRFRRPQKTDGNLDPVFAQAIHYGKCRHNQLTYSEDWSRIPLPDGSLGWQEYTAFDGVTANTTLTLNVDQLDPLGSTGAVSMVQGTPNGTTTSFLQRVVMPAKYSAWTYSFWGRSCSPRSITQRLRYGTRYANQVCNLTEVWQRFSLTVSDNTGLDFAVGWDIPQIQDGEISLFGPQVEPGATMSWYEGTATQGRCLSYNFADAVRDILTNPLWGLAQPVNDESFEDSALVVGALQLRCNGSVPSLAGESTTVNDVLNQLLIVRGGRLHNKAGVWALDYDTERSPAATFGTGTTIYNNIVGIGNVSRSRMDAATKSALVNYGLDVKPDTAAPFYKFKLEHKERDDFGEQVVYNLEFVTDHLTGDKTVQYIAHRTHENETTWPIQVGSLGHRLRAGQVVQVLDPDTQVENRLLWSENGTTTPWHGSGVSWAPSVLHPDQLAYGTTRLGVGGWSGQTISGLTVSQDWVHYRVYARSASGLSSAELRLGAASGSHVTQGFTVGTEWQELYLKRSFPFTETGDVFVQVRNIGANTIDWTMAQVTVDQNRSYIRTTTAGVDPQITWQIIETGRNGQGQADLSLVPYNPAVLFAHVTSDWAALNADTAGINPKYVPPPIVQGLVVPPDPPAATGLAGLDWSVPYGSSVDSPGTDRGPARGGERQANSWALVSFLMPETNTVRVGVQIRKTNLGIQENTGRKLSIYWQEVSSVSVNEVGLGNRAQVRIDGLVPGLRYEVRCVSYNSTGLTGAPPVTSIKTFVARGDETAPSPVDTAVMRQGTGKLIEIDVTINTFSEDYSQVRIYGDHLTAEELASGDFAEPTWETDKNGDPRAGTPLLIDRSQKLQFHKTDVEEGDTYYFWAVVEDYSENLSSPVVVLGPGNSPGLTVVPLPTYASELQLGNNTNLILNGGFESGVSDWTIFTPNTYGSVTTSTAIVYQGGTSLKQLFTGINVVLPAALIAGNAGAYIPNPGAFVAASQTLVGVASNLPAHFTGATYCRFDPILPLDVSLQAIGLIEWQTTGGTPVLDPNSNPYWTLVSWVDARNGSGFNQWRFADYRFRVPNDPTITKGLFKLIITGSFNRVLTTIEVYWDALSLTTLGILLRDIDDLPTVSGTIGRRVVVRDPSDGTIIGYIPIYDP